MKTMTLVERQIVKPNHKHFNEIDHVCFLSKNLYNSTLYRIRQHYSETGEYLNYNAVNLIFTKEKQVDYCALPRKVSKCTQMLLDKSYKSFFNKLKNGDKYCRPPKYLDKINGRQVAMYCKQALSFKKKGYVKLSGTDIFVKTDKDVQFIRLVPKNGYYVIEIGYHTIVCDTLPDNNRYAAIDLGVNNLATITSNAFSPIIINGKPIKSINHYYNQKNAKCKEQLANVNNQKTSKRLKSIHLKRYNKINDYFHKASCFIVNHLVSTNVNTLIIGYNEGWKQDTKMRKDDKQNFIYIPFLNFVRKLQYKCEKVGITVIVTEESYTSKCSFMNQDYIPTYGEDDEKYEPTGERIKRGLYRNNDQTILNADVNGSYNILRKTLIKQVAWNEKLFSDCVQVCSTPLVKSF